MAEASVFDVGTALLDRSGSETMSALKLQKLCFYTFGWYAHLTGRSLFPETFYAMQYGPVVGELLSAHATHKLVTRDQLMTQLAAREGYREDLDPFIDRVVDAVWSYYGQFSAGHLVDLTHSESVWATAWASRFAGSKRADMDHSSVVSFFVDRPQQAEEVPLLPPRVVTFESREHLAEMAERTSGSHPAFAAAFARLRAS